MRDFTVYKIDNGYIVRCGCMTLSFPSRQILVNEIDRYLQDPKAVEREYNTKYRPNAPQEAIQDERCVAEAPPTIEPWRR